MRRCQMGKRTFTDDTVHHFYCLVAYTGLLFAIQDWCVPKNTLVFKKNLSSSTYIEH
jgi:hypothetical protein